MFAHAIQRGQLPADFDAQLGAVTTFALIHGLIANWVMNPELIDIKRHAPKVVASLFRLFRCTASCPKP